MNIKKTKIILFSLAIFFGFLAFVPNVFAFSCSSTGANTNFNQSASWTSCNSTTPQTTDSITINNGHTITLNAGTTVTGITVNNGGILGFNTQAVINNGGLTDNGSITGTTATLSMAGSAQVIDGTGTYSPTGTISITDSTSIASTATLSFACIISVANTKTLTNNGNLTLTRTATGTLTGVTAGTFVNAATGVLNYAGDTITVQTFTATAAGNIVNYNDTSSSQTVLASTYDTLKIDDSGQIASLGGATTIQTGGTINIVSGTLQMNTRTITNNGTTTVTGTIKKSSTTGTPIFVGLITVASTGVWDTSDGNDAFEFRGGITNNSGTFTTGTGATTLTTNDQTLAGAGSITFGGSVTISTTKTITNNNSATVTVSGALTFTGHWTQGTNNPTLSMGSTNSGAGNLDTFTNSNTVIYGATSTIKIPNNSGGHYYNLTISGGTVTSAAVVVDNNLVVSGGTFRLVGSSLTVTGTTSVTGTIDTLTSATGTKAFTGLVTINAGGTFDATNQNPVITFAAGIKNDSFNICKVGASNSDTLIGNLSGSGSGGITWGGNMAVSSGTTTNTNSGKVTVTGTLTLTGAWVQGNGSSLVLGSATPFGGAGTFSASTATNTVSYMAGAATIKDPSAGTTHAYSNLVLGGSGAKTITSITTTNDLTLIGTATASLAANFTVGGVLTVDSNTSLTQGANTLTVTGDANIFGIFTASSSAITLSGNLNVNTATQWIKSTGVITFDGNANTKTLTASAIPTDYIDYWKFDETTTTAGATVVDSSFNKNNGTPSGSGGGNNLPQPSTDVPTLNYLTSTRSLSFDGTDDSVIMPNFTQTVDAASIWFKPTSTVTTATTDQTLFNFSVGTVGQGSLEIGASSDLFADEVICIHSIPVDNTNATCVRNISISAAWHNLIINWDFPSAKYHIYLDGVEQTTSAGSDIHASELATTASIRLGEESGNNYYDGKLDEFRMYDRSLTVNEITYLSGGASSTLATDLGSVTVGDGAVAKVLQLGSSVALTNVVVTNASTFNMTSSNYDLNVRGNLTLNSASTFTKPASGTGKLLFAGGTTQTVTDSNATKQDLGVTQISSYVTLAPTLTLTQHTVAQTIANQTFVDIPVSSTGSGKLLVVATGNNGTRTVTKVCTDGNTCGAGNSFTQFTNAVSLETTGGHQTDVWYLLSSTSGVTNIRVTFSGATGTFNKEGWFWEVSGFTAVGPDLASHVDDGNKNGNNYSTGAAITTTGASGFVVGVVVTTDVTSNPKSGNEFTSGGDVSATADAAVSLINSTARSHQPAWGESNFSGLYASSTAAFKETTLSNTTLNLGSSVKMTSLTIDSSQIFSNNGTTTLTLTGSGSGSSRPFIVNGTFTVSTGTIAYTGTSATDITSTTYNNLSLIPAGTPTYTLGTAGSQTINTVDFTIGNGADAVVVNHATYDPTLNISGNFLISASAGTFTKSDSPATITFKPTGSKTWTDNTNQDIGVVVIGSGASTPKITLGSSSKATSVTINSSHTLDGSSYTLSLTGTGTVFSNSGTYTAGTSTIKITDTTNTAATFAGGGGTFNNIWFARGASTASNTITGSNTFADFKDDGSAAHSILFTNGTTTTVTTFTVSGSAGNLITINSDNTATHALVKAGGGVISSDYLSIQHSVATPSSTWYAGTHSTNNQAVSTAGSGWIFSAPSTFDQKHFRFYRDNAGLNSADYYAAEDANYNVGVSNTFRLRIETANTGSGAGAIVRRLEFKEDSGAWTQITTGTNNVRLSDSSNFTDGDATTARLTAVGTFAAGQGKDTSSDTSSISLTNAFNTEDEYSLILQTGAAGHSYQFRITNAGTVLDTYTVTPAINTPDNTAPVPSGFNPATTSTIKTATPIIYYNLDEAGDCKASTTNNSYASMSGADCTGDGSTSGRCLMPTLGSNGSKTIYFACQDTWGNQDTSGTTHSVTYTLTLSNGAASGLIIKGNIKVKGNVIVK